MASRINKIRRLNYNEIKHERFNYDEIKHLKGTKRYRRAKFTFDLNWEDAEAAIYYLKDYRKYRDTALHLAVRCGDMEAVKRQLNGLGNVDAVNKNEVIPLYRISSIEKERVYSLLRNNSDVNRMLKMTPLFLAARKGDERIVQILLDHKAEMNSKLDTLSPLSIAIIRGHEEVVKLLLARGTDVTAKDNIFGDTPLHMALYCHREVIATEIFQKFIAKINSKSGKATVDVENNSGETPLYCAAFRGLNNFVAILLDHKADAGYKTKCQDTPFKIATNRGNIYTVGTFLELVDINILINSEIKNPNYVPFSRCPKIQDMIERHIIKKKVAGFHLNEYILAHSSFYEQNPFHRECEEEIERMQDNIVGLKISYHDILLSLNVESNYFKNRNLSRIFESGFYKGQYPIYALELERKLGSGVRRQELLRDSSEALISLLSGLTRLPDLCSEKIVSCLNNADLKNLIKACNSF